MRWLGHSAFEITSARGKLIYIDPWIEGNPTCPVKLDEITKADLVLVTHDHFDHIANAADISKKTGAVVIASPETAAKLAGAGANMLYGMGMNIGGTVEPIEGIKVTMVQAFHSSESGCNAGYIVQLEDDTTIYHAGDTGIFASMELLGSIYNIDVALLPIGSVFTMDPYQAAKALKLLKPRVAIPMHYKTFPILVQDAMGFVDLAQKEAPEVQVIILQPGQEYKLPHRS
jgi:L-ascorbate metabolism protein UlaG (beta-lactamase superfamily)